MKNHITLNLIPASLRGTSISAVTFSIFTCAAIGSWFTPTFFPVQPAPIDMQPIVNFLNAEDHSTWRYITFGFGDQFAYLNLLTTAATLDGSYHTARTVPELRESGIGQIDTAYWALKGIPAISPILQASGKYGVRWGFVSLRSFVPELKKAGWKFVKYLPNGIQVWENPDFTYWPSKPPPVDTFKSFSWGIFPMVSLLITLTLGTVHILKDRSEKIIRNGHTLVVGLIPLSLGFWYYQTIFEFNHKQVYFTYSNALFFLSDGLALIAVILWLAVSVPRNSFRPQSATVKLLFVLCSLITLSALWSLDPRTSIYIAMHFWLVLGLIHSMRDWHESWKAVILGFCAALSIQALMGIVGFIGQSTVFLGPLGLSWPGPITAATRAASIIKLAGGQSFLRAYGTFPHPNILGGFTVACLAATSALLLRDKKPNRLAALLLILGSSLLALTFSRSAWVAIIIFLTAIIFKSKYLDRKSVAILCITIILALGTTLIPLRNLFLNRTTAPSTNIEGFSLVGRIWLAQQAIAYIKEKPVLGVGAGSFVIQLAERSGKYNYIEPVHSIPLQVAAELGIIGFILLFAIAISIGRSFFETKKTNAIIMGALLIGLGTISLFDHYLWTLAPGRMLLGLVLGLWEGQIARDE
jgi:O-antigen ligase